MLNKNNQRDARTERMMPAMALAAVMALIGLTIISMLSYAGVVIATPTNTANAISVSLTVQGVCVPTLSNGLITFQTTKAGYFAPVANAETIGDSGTVPGNIYLYSTYGADLSGNWVYITNTFGVSNTLWNPTSDGLNNFPANALSNTLSTDTKLYVSPNPVVSNTIYFGVNIPANTPTGTYTQGITVSLTC